MGSIVSAPADLVIATSDGIDVRFTGIDLAASLSPHAQEPPGGHGVRIGLAAVRGAETMRRDGQFQAARLAWAQRRQDQMAEEEPVPLMPGFSVLDRVGVVLNDELGTEYRLVAGQAGGDGTEWESAWEFVPQPPKVAGILRLQFTLDGASTGKTCEVRVP
ncbi:hypothetical protein [Kocuria sp. U4B]